MLGLVRLVFGAEAVADPPGLPAGVLHDVGELLGLALQDQLVLSCFS